MRRHRVLAVPGAGQNGAGDDTHSGDNMTVLKYALAFVACVVVGNATAGTEDYKHLGERPAAGHVATDYYGFDYKAPSETYANIEWNAYRDKKEKRNTVMVIGLSGYDTYALSVLHQGPAPEGKDVLGVAQAKYPSLTFAPSDNPACVTTAADRPFQLTTRMIGFMAMCMDGKTRAVYELNISWQSLILMINSLDGVVAESSQCASDKLKDPATRCPDRIGTYAASYRTLLSSFATTGK